MATEEINLKMVHTCIHFALFDQISYDGFVLSLWSANGPQTGVNSSWTADVELTLNI